MRAESEPVVPGWVWLAAGATGVAGAIGAMIYAARKPNWDRLLARTGAPKELRPLAALQRYTESRGNPKAGLGRPELFPWWAEPRNASKAQQVHESEAAAKGYERNLEAYMESPYPRQMWIFGSGGPYGMLPSSALAPWRGTDDLRRGKVTPYDVFNPWRATVFFVDYVHRLTKRKQFRQMPPKHQNLLALKRGLASPRLLDDFEERKARSRTTRRNTQGAIEALKMDPEVIYTRIPLVWPDYPGATELVP